MIDWLIDWVGGIGKSHSYCRDSWRERFISTALVIREAHFQMVMVVVVVGTTRDDKR